MYEARWKGKISAYTVLLGRLPRLPSSYMPFAYRHPTNLLQCPDRTAFAGHCDIYVHYLHTCTCTYACTCIFGKVHVCKYINMLIYIYIYIYMYMYMYMYM